MERIAEFDELDEWFEEAERRGYTIDRIEGQGEDPFTHYYAHIYRTETRIGYFGDSNGSDSNHGLIAGNIDIYNAWMEWGA